MRTYNISKKMLRPIIAALHMLDVLHLNEQCATYHHDLRKLFYCILVLLKLRVSMFCDTLFFLILIHLLFILKVISNDELYYGESSYNAELAAISNVLVQKIIDSLNQAPNSVICFIPFLRWLYYCWNSQVSGLKKHCILCSLQSAWANQALDTCNSLLISFKVVNLLSFLRYL